MVNYWHKVLEIIESGEVTIQKIANDTGIRANKISMWKVRGLKPKYEDYIKLEAWHKKRYPEKNTLQFEMEGKNLAGVLLEVLAISETVLPALAALDALASGVPKAKVLKQYESAVAKRLRELKREHGLP